MKSVFLVLILAVFGGAGFWYITENSRKDRAEAYRQRQEMIEKQEAAEKERLERQRIEDERIRKERSEALAKEDAVRLFLNYLDREEGRLKDEVEECKLRLEKVSIDQDSLSDELQAIERANAARVASAVKRNEKQRDKIERVSAMLSSPVLNRLSLTYCGEDLSALRAKFEAEVQKIRDVDDRYQKRFKENLKRYDETVNGADAIVNKKLKAARDKYDSVSKGMDKNRLTKLKNQLASIEREADRISQKKSKSSWDVRHLADLQNQMVVLQNQISQYEDVGGLVAADLAHMEATEAETEARRKFDLAGKTLTLDNDAALLERDYEQDIYNLAARYEASSLDVIRQGIQQQRMIQANALSQAEKKLAFVRQSAVSMDFMNAAEVEEMRRKISQKISASILDGGQQ